MRDILLAGTGTLGGNLVKNLSSVDELIIVDPDIVEEKNIGSIFEKEDIGKFKVDVIAEKIKSDVVPIRSSIEDYLPKVRTIKDKLLKLDCRDTTSNSIPSWADIKLNIADDGIVLFTNRERTKLDTKLPISTSCDMIISEENLQKCCYFLANMIINNELYKLIKRQQNYLITPRTQKIHIEKIRQPKNKYINLNQIYPIISRFSKKYKIKIVVEDTYMVLPKNISVNDFLFACDDLVKYFENEYKFNYILYFENRNNEIIVRIKENYGLA